MDILKTIKDWEEINHGITNITWDRATLCWLMFDDITDVIESEWVVGIQKWHITYGGCQTILKQYKKIVNYYK